MSEQPKENSSFEPDHESGLGDQQTEEQDVRTESGNAWEGLTPEETAEQLRGMAKESAGEGRVEDVNKAWEMAHAAHGIKRKNMNYSHKNTARNPGKRAMWPVNINS